MDDEGDEPEGRSVGGALQPSNIRNKQKRSEVHAKQQREKKKEKKKKLLLRRKEIERAEALGAEPPKRQVPKTIESTREADETVVCPDDDELQADDAGDEMAAHFSHVRAPKVLVTTAHSPSKITYRFIRELLAVIPGATFYERGPYHIKQIVKFASNRDFTGVLVINENQKAPNGLLLINLPDGPTAHFKVSNVVLSKRIKGHGRPTRHRPELILNNFGTRLGHRVGRLLASLFPQDPQFRGRRVVTLHNQRDFIFFRHHRYIFEKKEAPPPPAPRKLEKKGVSGGKEEGPSAMPVTQAMARLQECGPRFTLKLQSLQHGTFDSKGGEYEWVHKPDMDTSRRRFFL